VRIIFELYRENAKILDWLAGRDGFELSGDFPQLRDQLHGKAPGLESVCAGVGGDGFGITEFRVFVLQPTPKVRGAVPKTLGGYIER
jgi:hypothetical protein